MSTTLEEKIEKQKAELQEKKKKIEFKEQLLRKNKLKKKTKNWITIGKLAEKTGINFIENEILIGAFLEIQSYKSNETFLTKWRKNGEEFLNKKTEKTPLIISFKTEPIKEVLEKLKELKMKWNSFRKEWYGHGKKSEIEAALKSTDAVVEEIS